MKIKEIMFEAPVGFGSRVGNRLASYVPGGIGRRALGRQQTGKISNNIKKKLQIWMGTTGQNKLTFANFKIFMNSIKIPLSLNKEYQENDYLSKKGVDQMILQSIQQEILNSQGSKQVSKLQGSTNRVDSKQPVDLSKVNMNDLIKELNRRNLINAPERL